MENNIKLTEYYNKLENLTERWKCVSFNNEKSIYKISSFGRLYNAKTKKFLNSSDSHGYLYTTLYNGKDHFKVSIHRLVAMYFCQVPKRYKEKGLTFKNLTVNHKNGIKTCNASFNLEWVTTQENTDHAWREGLCDNIRGENTHLAKITEEKAKQIIGMIMDRQNNAVIAASTGASLKTIQHIRSKECWKHLTHDLNFPKLGNAKPNTTPPEVIHGICKMLEEKKYSDTEIGEKFGKSREYVKDIRTKRRQRKISENYDF